MATVPASTIAEWFVWRSNQEDRRISNLKLQKLVFYAQAWHLAEFHMPLFDDRVEAWIHGPVVPSVYRDYRRFGSLPISASMTCEPGVDGDTREHLEETWDVYGGYDAVYLEMLTHEEAPWQLAREGLEYRERSTAEIGQDLMQAYYSALKAQVENETGVE